MTKKNELSLVSKEAADSLIPGLFSDINLSSLDAAITNMGNVSGDLSDAEKETAVEIISEWNESVVGRLHAKEREMHEIANFLNTSSTTTHVNGVHYKDFGEDLAKSTKTTKSFTKLMELNDKIDDIIEDRPVRTPSTELTTFLDDIKYQKEFEADIAVYTIKEEVVRRDIAKALRAWKKELAKTDVAKEIINGSKRFISSVGKMKEDARDKSQMAKLNISISSEQARNSIRELLNFTQTI